MAGQEQVPPGAGQEAEVLALAPVRHGQLGIARELTDHRLLELAEREPQPGQVVRAGGGAQACMSGPCASRPRRAAGSRAVLHDARVVTGREPPGTQLGSGLQHGVEAHLAVAPDAGVRGATAAQFREEVVDNPVPEWRPQVQGEVRDAHAVRERTRARDRLR